MSQLQINRLIFKIIFNFAVSDFGKLIPQKEQKDIEY